MALIQAKYPQYHPVMAMVDIAQEAGETLDEKILAFHCHKEVARYVVAIDKFVEVKQEVRETKRVVVELFGGQDHPRAVAHDEPPVLEDRGAGVSDVVDKLAQRAEAERVTPAAAREEIRREIRSVRTTGSVDDIGSPLLGVWGDPSTDGGQAGRFG